MKRTRSKVLPGLSRGRRRRARRPDDRLTSRGFNTVLILITSGCALSMAGCEPPTSAEPSPTVAGTFVTPAPRDPRIEGAQSQSDVISAALATIHDRLTDMRVAYRDKSAIGGSLKEVADQMRPLIEASRNHCDAMRRAAEDLRSELPHAQAGYAAAGASYRQRSEGYRDAALKSLTLKIADHFDRMAAGTPKRLELVGTFLKELQDAQDFLAETDRCVRDTAAALAVFSAHAKVPEVPVDARAFSQRLGQFLEVATEYEDKLIEKPPEPPAPMPAGRLEERTPRSRPIPVTPPLPKGPPAPPARFTQKATDDILQPRAVLQGDFLQGGRRYPSRMVIVGRSGDRFTAQIDTQAPDGPCRQETSGTVRGSDIIMVSKAVSGNILPKSDQRAQIAGLVISGQSGIGTKYPSTFSFTLVQRAVPTDTSSAPR